MEPKPFLEGELIYLRQLLLEDVNFNYVNWFNDVEVCKHNSHHAFPLTLALALEYVKRVRSQKDYLVLAMIAKDKNKHIGNISLQNISPIHRSAEYAIILGDREYWGKGVAKEASVLVLRHGFGSLNLHRIYCGTSEANIAMQRLAASLGFKQEGVSRSELFKDNAFKDIIRYGLLREEFAL